MPKSMKRIMKFSLMIVALLSSPLVAKAELIFDSGYSIVHDYKDNGSITTLLDTPHVYNSGFPETGSLDGPYGGLTYSLMQSAGATHSDWSGSTSIPERDPGLHALVTSTLLGNVYFTPTVNETYSITSSFTESGTTGYSDFMVYLNDNTLGVTVYLTEKYRFSSGSNSITFGSASGTLLAGHQYVFQGRVELRNHNESNLYPQVNNPGSATAEWHLTTSSSTVPEPSSLALAGLGGIGLIVGAIRRRRAAAV